MTDSLSEYVETELDIARGLCGDILGVLDSGVEQMELEHDIRSYVAQLHKILLDLQVVIVRG